MALLSAQPMYLILTVFITSSPLEIWNPLQLLLLEKIWYFFTSSGTSPFTTAVHKLSTLVVNQQLFFSIIMGLTYFKNNILSAISHQTSQSQFLLWCSLKLIRTRVKSKITCVDKNKQTNKPVFMHIEYFQKKFKPDFIH